MSNNSFSGCLNCDSKAIKEKNLWPVSYFIIDRASLRRDPTNGLTVFDDYKKHFSPLIASKSDSGSVLFGINEVKRLLHVNPDIGKPLLRICRNLTNTIDEIMTYSWHRQRRTLEKNPLEQPRKLNDHLMDCLRNTVLTKPWMHKSFESINLFGKEGEYGYS